MSNKNVDTAKEKIGQDKPILSVGELAKKLGVQPKRLRAFLRSENPRDIKGKKWEINSTLARKIEKDYKAKIKTTEEAKKTQEALPGKVNVIQNTETILDPQSSIENTIQTN
jgi:phage antirepressor YoqD-like protein